MAGLIYIEKIKGVYQVMVSNTVYSVCESAYADKELAEARLEYFKKEYSPLDLHYRLTTDFYNKH